MTAPARIALTPALVALDWGTTHVRAALVAHDGRVLEERHGQSGVGQFESQHFEQRFEDLTASWGNLPAIAAGMVGSRQGWQEAAYLPCPTGLADLSAALTPVAGREGVVIVPGLKMDGERFDVMRGEESQIAGLLARKPHFTGTVVMPGSHCKWVRLERGRIEHFTTYMTGETFAVLSRHTMLRHSVEGDAKGKDTKAFQQAVAEVFTGHGSSLARLFDLRGRTLLANADGTAQRERLSGLLIGMELEAAARDGYDVQDFTLVGSTALNARYQEAGAVLQADMETHEGTDLIWPALTAIAREAGIIAAPNAATRGAQS
ncbi:MAG: 2-dehydro-3-deoxygalactonokinase [Pseudomonadota bacterium]